MAIIKMISCFNAFIYHLKRDSSIAKWHQMVKAWGEELNRMPNFGTKPWDLGIAWFAQLLDFMRQTHQHTRLAQNVGASMLEELEVP